MKQIFFKTVREDGTSVWAIGQYCRRYEVGKHYKFDPRTPAHVFGLDTEYSCIEPQSSTAYFPEQSINHNEIYAQRAESNGGNRVLICYGEVKIQKVPVCHLFEDWDLTKAWTEWRFTSDDFDVIGEIKASYRDHQYAREGTITEIRVIKDLPLPKPETKS